MTEIEDKIREMKIAEIKAKARERHFAFQEPMSNESIEVEITKHFPTEIQKIERHGA